MRFFDWKMDAIAGGRGFHVTVGAFSTPITGGGNGTVIETTEPEFVVSVPLLTTLIPIRVSIQCQVPLVAADSNESEILLTWGLGVAWDTTGTSTEETIYNMKYGHSATSLCSCESAFTADITLEPENEIELARAVQVANLYLTTDSTMWGTLDLLYEPLSPPLIVGPAMLAGFWGGTVATTGFAQIEWLEFPTSYFN